MKPKIPFRVTFNSYDHIEVKPFWYAKNTLRKKRYRAYCECNSRIELEKFLKKK